MADRRTKIVKDDDVTGIRRTTIVAALDDVAVQPVAPLHDLEEIFRLYALHVGDLEKTAYSCNRSVEDIAEFASAGGWPKRIAVLIKLQRSNVPGDAERCVNRAVNFVQADRLRSLIERVLRGLCNMTQHELHSMIVSTVTKGRGENQFTQDVINTRPFADLATALEKCHSMTYQALADTSSDRKGRSEDNVEMLKVGDMHIKVAEAMRLARTGISGPGGGVAGHIPETVP